MNLQKVTSGQQLVISAGDWNAFIDAAVAHQASRHDRSSGTGLVVRHDVMLKNGTETEVPRWGVMGVQEKLFKPADGLAAFEQGFDVVGRSPLEADLGSFVVAVESIAAGGIGRAIRTGYAIVRVSEYDEDEPPFVDIDPAETAHLVMHRAGSAEIVWASATEIEIGLRYALVRLACRPRIAPYALQVFKLATPDSMEDGDDANQAVITYASVTDMEDVEVATAVNPGASPHHYVRPNLGAVAAGTIATGYFTPADELRIVWCNEQTLSEACAS